MEARVASGRAVCPQPPPSKEDACGVKPQQEGPYLAEEPRIEKKAKGKNAQREPFQSKQRGKEEEEGMHMKSA